MTKNHPVWIHSGKIETCSGEKLTIVDGVCLEKGCAIELISGSITTDCPIAVTITPSQTIMPLHLEGVLIQATIKLPNSGLRLGHLSVKVPVKDGATVRIFLQKSVD